MFDFGKVEVPDEMVLLPEGRREKQSYKLYTDTELFIADMLNQKNADLVTIMEKVFEIVGVFPNQSGVISHYKAIAALV